VISKELKVIFIHIPRTGGTSIEKALIGKNWWHVDRATKHLTWNQARQHYAEYWDEYLKFSVVRNPWDWIVSLYHSHNYTRSAARGVSWSDYVKHPRLSANEQDTIIQSEIIGDELDFILRFETLDDDFKRLCSMIGMATPELPNFSAQSGRSGENKRHYSSYYNGELRDIIANRHIDDIRRFNYRFEQS
jgi:chondroitin 4-sulfotransferase 11